MSSAASAIDDAAKAFCLKHGFVPSPLEPSTLMPGLRALP